VYFLQTLESGSSTIYRIKHDGTKETELFKNANINYFVLADSKLYFLSSDKYSEEYTIESISKTGGNRTTYGKIPYYSECLFVSGNNIYYCGMPPMLNSFDMAAGIIRFNVSTKEYTNIKEDYEISMFFFTSNFLILENYKNESLHSISLYDLQSGSWRNV
jgi:hypothetical protein